MVLSPRMRKKRICVALSGGVDSAVAAALLQGQHYEVEGVYLKYAPPDMSEFISPTSCPWEDDLSSAHAVGEHLGIPVRSLNVEREYDEHVLQRFLREYQIGRTPNPDTLCNDKVKFGFFLQWALDHGFDAVATGHYARITQRKNQWILRAGIDPSKDQSYFLYALRSSLLPKILFPVGNLTKGTVRAIAHSIALPNARRPDSQGICFLGNMSVRKFLLHRIPQHPGPVMTSSGERIGTHAGISLYTIGQRHGLGIGGGEPYYVIRKSVETNTVFVAPRRTPSHLLGGGCDASGVSWIVPPSLPRFRCSARIRYRQPLVTASVTVKGDGTMSVVFDQPQRAVSPGQAIVFYDGDVVLGGATIEPEILTQEKPHAYSYGFQEHS